MIHAYITLVVLCSILLGAGWVYILKALAGTWKENPFVAVSTVVGNFALSYLVYTIFFVGYKVIFLTP